MSPMAISDSKSCRNPRGCAINHPGLGAARHDATAIFLRFPVGVTNSGTCELVRSALSEGDCRANSENESVRNIGAGRAEHILEIRLETEPSVEVDLICCLEYNFVARV